MSGRAEIKRTPEPARSASGRCIDALRMADFASLRSSSAEKLKITEHLATCPACQQALERIRQAQATLREISTLEPEHDVERSAARIEAALRWASHKPAPKISWKWRWAFPVATAAAAAAIVLLLVGIRQRQPILMPQPSMLQSTAEVRPAAPASLRALVTLFTGEVKLTRHGAEQPIDLTTELLPGDTITTGSNGRIAVQWDEASGLALTGQSQLTLGRLEARTQELQIARGQVAVRVRPHQTGESLRVLTPAHVVSVRGTWFTVGVEERGTSVEVIEGAVEIEQIGGGGSSSLLAAPMRAFFMQGRAKSEAEHTLSTKQVTGIRQATEMALLTWYGHANGLEELFAHTAPLHIVTTPLAAIAIDGVPVGAGSLWLRRSRGAHLIELTRPGFQTQSRWISLGATSGELRSTMLPSETPQAPVSSEVIAAEELKHLIENHRPAISACYERLLKLDHSLAGTITLSFSIGEAGQVLSTAVENDTMGKLAVTECLQRAAVTWNFERTRNVTIVYPFTFSSK